MANVKATVVTPFLYKGRRYEKDEEITLSPKLAATYSKINFIELDKEAEKKVEAVTAPEAPKKAAKK